MKLDYWEKEKWIFRSFIELICLSSEWKSILSYLSSIFTATNINRGIEEKLHHQLLLHLCGQNLRRLLSRSQQYLPELLREPYLRPLQRKKLLKFISAQVNNWIRKLAISVALRDTTLSLNNIVRVICRNTIHRDITIQPSTSSRDPSLFGGTLLSRNDDEILGSFVIATLDVFRLFSSLRYSIYPTILSPTDQDVHIISGEERESNQNKYQIETQNMFSFQFETHPVVSESSDAELIDLSDAFLPQNVELICSKLQGCLLPETLRGHIWIHRSLRKDWEDPPLGPSWMNELQRLGSEKGIPSDLLSLSFVDSKIRLSPRYYQSASYQKVASVSELARSVVHLQFLKGFPYRLEHTHTEGSSSQSSTLNDSFIRTVSRVAYQRYQVTIQSPSKPKMKQSPQHIEVTPLEVGPSKHKGKRDRHQLKQMQAITAQSEQISDHILCRRAELLVRAAYILTGEINPRAASIALMIMIVFPSTQPVSEKTLKLFMHIFHHCLPSEHMNHSYSIATIATETFSNLRHDDNILRNHLEVPDFGMPFYRKVSPYLFNLTMTGNQDLSSMSPRKPPTSSEQTSPRTHHFSPPPAFRLLKNWLETGFVGYISEFAVMFIWDQFAMWGGKKRDWHQLLPIICVSILRQLRDNLLASTSEDQIMEIIKNSSKYIRSKNLFQEIRLRLSGIPRPKWFSSPFSNITLDKVKAVTYIQKMFRGHRARLRFHQLKSAVEHSKFLEDERKSKKLQQDWKNLSELQHPKTQKMETPQEIPQTPPQIENMNALDLPQSPSSLDKKGTENNESKSELPPSRPMTSEASPMKISPSKEEGPNETLSDPPSSPKQDIVQEVIEDPSLSMENKVDHIEEEKSNPELPSRQSTPNKSNQQSQISAPPTSTFDENCGIVKQIMEDILRELEKMALAPPHTPKLDVIPQIVPTPLQTSRTEHTSQSNLTDYTMVTDDDPIDEEGLMKQMRSTYLKEWADMRGLVFDTDDEAEKALKEFQNKKKPPAESIPPPVPPPEIKEEPPQKEPIEVPPLIQPQSEDIVPPLESSPRKSSRTPRSRSSTGAASNTSSRRSSRRRTSLFNVGPAELQNDSDEEKMDTSEEFRKTFPPAELEALLGFFTELRSDISELLRMKRQLKLEISEWKAEFFLQHGREANWEERKTAIGQLYEKYHEVGFKANKSLKELRESEDELLISWAARRSAVSPRKRSLILQR